MELVSARDLRLADVVEVFDGPFGTAIVNKIEENDVHLFRPYGHNSDFETTGGVTCYVGIEQFSVGRNDRNHFKLHRRGGQLR